MTCYTYLPIVQNPLPRLQQLFGNYGIKFGFCVHEQSFTRRIRRSIITEHANFVSTGSQLNMKFTQPERNVFDWSRPDNIVKSAHELGIEVHGIPASWAYPLNPDWLVNGTWTNEQLADILKTHVSTLAARYEGKFVSLNVANEAYITGFDPVYGGVWQPLGDDYVRISFESARENSTYPILYNSFFPEPADEEYDKALGLVSSGLADGIGIQLHLWTGSWQATLTRTEAFLARIRAANGWCRFSEVGVLGEDAEQAVAYAAITRLAKENCDIVKAVVVWGVSEWAWRSRPWLNQGVVLFDTNGQPKAAYYAMVKELRNG